MSERLAYAIADEAVTPRFWELEIIDLDTGARVDRVFEVDVTAGWLVRAKLNERGEVFADGAQIARERVEGRFEIRRAPPP